jgi:hypothetical protein
MRNNLLLRNSKDARNARGRKSYRKKLDKRFTLNVG